jgi:hypothetical protein
MAKLIPDVAPDVPGLAADLLPELAEGSGGEAAADRGVHPDHDTRRSPTRGRICAADGGLRSRPVDARSGQADPQPPVPLQLNDGQVLRRECAGVRGQGGRIRRHDRRLASSVGLVTASCRPHQRGRLEPGRQQP